MTYQNTTHLNMTWRNMTCQQTPLGEQSPPGKRAATGRTRLVQATATLLTAGMVAAGCSTAKTAEQPKPAAATVPSATSTTVPATAASSSTTSTTTIPTSTSTTVYGSASTSLIAASSPPSLAGAYPVDGKINLVTVLKTLQTYEDWTWSHPNPSLVANYALKGEPDYAPDLKVINEFASQGLHAAPVPTPILWAKVATPGTVASATQKIGGGVLYVVVDIEPVPLLKADGQPSGEQFTPPVTGPQASMVSFGEQFNTQFKFLQTTLLHPAGGIAAFEAAHS